MVERGTGGEDCARSGTGGEDCAAVAGVVRGDSRGDAGDRVGECGPGSLPLPRSPPTATDPTTPTRTSSAPRRSSRPPADGAAGDHQPRHQTLGVDDGAAGPDRRSPPVHRDEPAATRDRRPGGRGASPAAPSASRRCRVGVTGGAYADDGHRVPGRDRRFLPARAPGPPASPPRMRHAEERDVLRGVGGQDARGERLRAAREEHLHGHGPSPMALSATSLRGEQHAAGAVAPHGEAGGQRGAAVGVLRHHQPHRGVARRRHRGGLNSAARAIVPLAGDGRVEPAMILRRSPGSSGPPPRARRGVGPPPRAPSRARSAWPAPSPGAPRRWPSGCRPWPGAAGAPPAAARLAACRRQSERAEHDRRQRHGAAHEADELAFAGGHSPPRAPGARRAPSSRSG